MKELKEHQKPMTIEEQIQNLKDLGLFIDNNESAKSVLGRISYYRLIKAYSLGLKNPDGTYKSGSTLAQILSLYLFNSLFRSVLFPLIEDIEVQMRCSISNYFCIKYGVLKYKDSTLFQNKKYHDDFLASIKVELDKNSRNPFVKNFRENYVGGDLPFYALVEIMSFGDLSKYYKNMLSPDKKAIASSTFGIGYTFLESWLESLAYVRNICAHYGRLYNAKLSKSPKLYDQYIQQNISNYSIFAVLLCLQVLCKKNRHWSIFLDGFEECIKIYPCIDLSKMGFPENWRELLHK